MKKVFFAAALLASTSLGILLVPAAQAETKPPKDTYPTKAAAEARATKLKCVGVHSVGTMFMACKDAAAYAKAVKKSGM